MAVQILEERATWKELIWRMAGGSKAEYNNFMATDILDFWGMFDLWREDVKRETDNIKAKQHGRQ